MPRMEAVSTRKPGGRVPSRGAAHTKASGRRAPGGFEATGAGVERVGSEPYERRWKDKMDHCSGWDGAPLEGIVLRGDFS